MSKSAKKSIRVIKQRRPAKPRGDCLTATSSGDYSEAASSGDYSRATSSGGSSTARSTGDGSMAASNGDGSMAAQDGIAGIACAIGDCVETKAGERGLLIATWWDATAGRYRAAIGYVGEGGIKAGVVYVVRDGKLVRKSAP